MTSKSISQAFIISILDVLQKNGTQFEQITNLVSRNIEEASNDLTFFCFVIFLICHQILLNDNFFYFPYILVLEQHIIFLDFSIFKIILSFFL